MSIDVTEEHIPYMNITNKGKSSIYLNTNSYYGKAIGRNIDKSIYEENSSSEFKSELLFINNTSHDVTIMGRDGLAILVKSNPNINKAFLIIRKVYTLRNTALKSAVKCVNSMNVFESEDLEYIRDTLSNLTTNEYSDIKIVIDYEVSISDINNNDKTIYHYQTDLLVSLKDVINISKHPYSSRFENIGEFGITRNYVNTQSKELQMKIRYVDHTPHASPKYINILGNVKVLYPEKDAPFRNIKLKGPNNKVTNINCTDYVEIFSTSKNDINSKNKHAIKIERFSLEEAKEKFGIYDTYTEALNNGNSDLVKKKELADKEHSVNLMKIKLQEDKSKHEEESDQRKRELNLQSLRLQQEKNDFDLEKQKLANDSLKVEKELADIKNIRAMLDMRLGYQNLDFEMHKNDINLRMQNRKDTIDVIKFVPSLIVAVVGLIGIYYKLNNQQK